MLVERAVTAFRPLQPQVCSIYDPHFWRHERFWKVPAATYLQLFNGTPFKNLIWRLLGVRIGRRVFDDGCYLTERTLVTIGDDCTLNAGSMIQCHSQEDGTFKSDRITIGAGCTLGVGAFVHYGVTMGDGAVLAPDSFLMKGEDVPPHARWGGNPARRCASTRRPAGAQDQHDDNRAAVLVRGDDTGKRGTQGRFDGQRLKPAGSSGAAVLLAGGFDRDPAVDPRTRCRASPSTRRRSPTTSRRRCAGWPTSWGCRSARCCWPRTPRCWPRCPASRRS